MKTKKEPAPAEESIFLRILWSAQTITCFYLIALIDPHVCFFNFFGLKIPLLLFDFWLAVLGMLLSYYYRHRKVKWLEWLGIATIFLFCTWFVDFMRMQFMSTEDIDVLLPTVHLMGGLFVSHSFELRSRNDFNFSLIFSIFLVCFAACLGKGALFGLGMFVYVVLAATLLLLDCESRTFGSVQARAIDGAQSFQMQRSTRSEKTANLLFPTFALLGLSVCFFLVAPRAESLADQVSAKIYSFIKKDSRLPSEHIPNNRVRTPFRTPRASALDQRPDEREKAGPKSPKHDKDKEKGKGAGHKKDKPGDSIGNAPPLPEPKTPAKAKPPRTPYSRREEKKKLAEQEKSRQQNSRSDGIAAKGEGNPNNDPDAVSNDTGANKNPSAANLPSMPEHDPARQKQNPDARNDSAAHKQNASHESASCCSSSSSSSSSLPKNKGTESDANKGNSSGAGNESAEKKQDRNNRSDGAATNAPPDSKKEKNASAGKDASSRKAKGDGKKEPGPKQKESESKKEEVHFIPDSLSLTAQAATEDTPIFSVICNRTVYFKQGGYDQFDGQNWTVSEGLAHGELPRAENGNFTAKEASPVKLPSSVPAIRLKQKYHMLCNLDSKLMTAGNPYEIEYAGPAIDIDECGNLTGGWTLVKGLEYQVWSDAPMYDLKTMRAEGLPGDAEEERLHGSFSRFMQIPQNHSEEFYELARKLTGPQDNWFVQAESISNYLRQNFKYSLDKSGSKSDAHQNAIDRFLFDSKRGDCKDFASAFVILCRASGIPARLVVGFSPGDFDSASGARVVKRKNTHAWGEIYFPNYGWIPFDATPTGVMPAREEEEERYFSSVGEKLEGALKSQASAGDKSGASAGSGITFKTPDGKTLVVNVGPWEIFKGVMALFAVMILSGPIMFLCRDAFGKIRLPRRMHPASKIYCGLLGDLKAVGISRNDSQTGSELLQLLDTKLANAEEIERAAALKSAVEDFITDYNAHYFGGYGNLKKLEQKRAQIKAMLKGKKLIATIKTKR